MKKFLFALRYICVSHVVLVFLLTKSTCQQTSGIFATCQIQDQPGGNVHVSHVYNHVSLRDCIATCSPQPTCQAIGYYGKLQTCFIYGSLDVLSLLGSSKSAQARRGCFYVKNELFEDQQQAVRNAYCQFESNGQFPNCHS